MVSRQKKLYIYMYIYVLSMNEITIPSVAQLWHFALLSDRGQGFFSSRHFCRSERGTDAIFVVSNSSAIPIQAVVSRIFDIAARHYMT